MINEITVSGFKSIRSKQTLRIRKLTIISGANSSGKSSMLQPLLIIKQSLESPYDPGTLRILGVNAKFQSGEELLTKSGAKKKKGSEETFPEGKGNFTVGIKTDKEEVNCTYGWKPKAGFTLVKLSHQTKDEGIAQEYMLGLSKEKVQILGRKRFNDIFQHFPEKIHSQLQFEISRDRTFLKVIGRLGKDVNEFLRFNPADNIARAIKNIIHLPGLRGNPERTYPVTSIGDSYPGLFQEYAASLIYAWGAKSDKVHIRGLRDDMKKLGLGWKVAASKTNDTQLEVKIGRLHTPDIGGANDLVSIADVGLGVSQTLPLLVALRAADNSHIVEGTPKYFK